MSIGSGWEDHQVNTYFFIWLYSILCHSVGLRTVSSFLLHSLFLHHSILSSLLFFFNLPLFSAISVPLHSNIYPRCVYSLIFSVSLSPLSHSLVSPLPLLPSSHSDQFLCRLLLHVHIRWEGKNWRRDYLTSISESASNDTGTNVRIGWADPIEYQSIWGEIEWSSDSNSESGRRRRY